MTISNFYLAYGATMHATVTLGGGRATAQLTGVNADGVSWISINGGVAFLNLIPGDGASLRIETWGTDARDMTAASIDIFTVPINANEPFPASLNNLQVASLHNYWVYTFTAIPGNPNAFNLDAANRPR